jgi:FixJ family two-component response regulator
MATLPAAGSRLRVIIIVEDAVEVRRSLQLLLRGRGWDVRAFGSARAVLDDPQANEAACLVADYRMSDIDGVELLRQLRGRGWKGPAVMITGYPSPELEKVARDAGYAEVVEKPIPDLTLPEIIRRLLDGDPG